MTPVIIAHRGASYLAERDNTLEAFQLAIEIGADYVEFDIRRTKDKKLIVVHDADIDGTYYKDLSYNEICERTAPQGYTIPLLIDVLKLCQGKIKLDIEFKEGGYEKQVILLVRDMFHYDQFMMKSFDDKVVARIKAIDPEIKTGLLIGMQVADAKRRFNEYFPERRLKQCNADFVSPYYSLATREFVHRMRRHRKGVYIWTVNGVKNLEKYMHHRPDGIITDMPDGALYVRRDYIRGK
jgi:glycerophosphoryl diester phosphodiesterase